MGERVRLPDAASVQSVLAGLQPASAHAALAKTVSQAFPGFAFTAARVEDFYRRGDALSVFVPGRYTPRRPPRLGSTRARCPRRRPHRDAEIGLPFAWFFLMAHGHWIDPDAGHAIADGLREARVRRPDRDAGVLLAWADRPYLF